jgi:hypothetical protein
VVELAGRLAAHAVVCPHRLGPLSACKIKGRDDRMSLARLSIRYPHGRMRERHSNKSCSRPAITRRFARLASHSPVGKK